MAISSTRGSATAAIITWCLADNWGSTGKSPSSSAVALRSVSNTTSDLRRLRRPIAATTARQSDSTSSGCNGAIALTSCASSSVRDAPNTPARLTRSWARKSTWSPARDASAASSSAASIDQSSRGHPAGSAAVGSTPTRPAAIRPVSSTITTRRSRSGRQVRTMTSARRAVARQSIERTSSPTTYSRSESNSVPCPRISVGNSPSISRSLASRDGRCLRDRNGGSTRTWPATARELCRPASPSGPIERAVTAAARWSPRRTGCSAVWIWCCAPAGTLTVWARGVAPALGGHASRMLPRNRRRPSLSTCSPASTC